MVMPLAGRVVAAVAGGLLAAWLIVAYAGFALLLWPFAARGVASAFVDAGSSLFTLGFAVPAGTAPAVIVFLAAATGLVILTLQIAYRALAASRPGLPQRQDPRRLEPRKRPTLPMSASLSRPTE